MGQVPLTSLIIIHAVLYINILVQDIKKAESNPKGIFYNGGGGQIPLTFLTSLTIAHAVLELNIAVQGIKPWQNLTDFIHGLGVLKSSYISYNSSTRIISEVSCTKHK